MSDTTKCTPAEVRSLAARTWAGFTGERYEALSYARDDLAQLTARLLARGETRLAKVHADAYVALTDRARRVGDARLARLTR